MAGSNASTPKAVQDCHALLLWIIPHLVKFPRVRRFTLGERIETALLFVLEQLVEAAYSKDRARALQLANQKLEVARHLWRLAQSARAGSILNRLAQSLAFYGTHECGARVSMSLHPGRARKRRPKSV